MSRRSSSDFIEPPGPPLPPPGTPVSPANPPPLIRPASGRGDNSKGATSVSSINEFQGSNEIQGQVPKISPPPQPNTAFLDGPVESLEDAEDFGSKWDFKSIIRRLVPYALNETPSWLISLVVHVAIVLLLALIPLSDQIGNTISLIVGMSEETEVEGELAVFDIQNEQELVAETEDNTVEMLTESLTEIPVEIVSESMPLLPELGLALPMRNGLRGRSGAMKSALLKAYGGTAGTEDAVAAGLEWLARNQKSDGSWSLVGPYREGGVNENKPAATAMALLAFMGAGNTHLDGEYRMRVKSGMAFLLKLQDREGFFAAQSAGNQRTYAQAQCSIAVCELFGMTSDEELRKPAQLAVQYAQKAQSKGGGWRYQPRTDGDTSVTGWYVMALISGRMAGLDVDSEVLERVHEFLNTVQRQGDSNAANPEGELYAYQSYSKAIPSMTAEGILCRMYIGWPTDDPRIQQGAKHLADRPISSDDGRIAYYYWYYATTTLHHIGGANWNRWNDIMKVELPAMQIKSGPERGSWPIGLDPHASTGGKLYATCMAIYCLESYYRHLPLSEMAAKPTN